MESTSFAESLCTALSDGETLQTIQKKLRKTHRKRMRQAKRHESLGKIAERFVARFAALLEKEILLQAREGATFIRVKKQVKQFRGELNPQERQAFNRVWSTVVRRAVHRLHIADLKMAGSFEGEAQLSQWRISWLEFTSRQLPHLLTRNGKANYDSDLVV